MKIAYHIGSMVDKAENELSARLSIATKNLGHLAAICRTSTDVEQFAPDLVFSLHTSIPKLTEYKTVGCMWNPPHFFANTPEIMRNAVSYDIHLSASDKMTDYLRDVSYPMYRDFQLGTIYPSCHFVPFRPRKRPPDSVAYLGTNWDGFRYAKEMDALSQTPFMQFFGPGAAWKRFGDRHSGPIAFNGTSVVESLYRCGATLSLHRPEHVEFDIPNMRVFEAVAASSILISDDHGFVKRNFADSAFYLEKTDNPTEFTEQLSDIFAFIQANPDIVAEMTHEAHRVFSERFCLEKLLADAVLVASDASAGPRRSKALEAPTCQVGPEIDCIIRAGLRDVGFLRRALQSVVAQTYPRVRVIVVNNGDSEIVRDVLSEFAGHLEVAEIVVKYPKGRSHSLWQGLAAVGSEYFCILDDDDRIHPDHLASLVSILSTASDAVAAYGGAIRVLEGRSSEGQEESRETRELVYFHGFDRQRLLQTDNFITSNSFLARSRVLDEELLRDPDLQALEDLWLLIMLASRGKIIPSWRVSSEFFWRQGLDDNITFNEDAFAESRRRILARLHFMPRPATIGKTQDPFPLRSEKQAHGPTSPVRGVEFVDADPPCTSVFGYIDAAKPVENGIEIVGWAKWRNVSSEQKIVISGIQGIVTASEIVPRPDIAVHMGDWRYYLSGFRIRFRVAAGFQDQAVTVFSLEDGGEICRLSFAEGVTFPLSTIVSQVTLGEQNR